MRRLLYAILLAFVSCQPCPAQTYPEYWKLSFGYIGSKGSVNFPQGRFWLLPDTLKYQADTIKANKGFVSDSTAYVLKFWFKRNDTMFVVVNSDTLYWPKKP